MQRYRGLTINGSEVVSSANIIKEGDFWVWKIITINPFGKRTYYSEINFLSKEQAEKSLDKVMDEKLHSKTSR